VRGERGEEKHICSLTASVKRCVHGPGPKRGASLWRNSGKAESSAASAISEVTIADFDMHEYSCRMETAGWI
jgi:hypothetical protein